jgi:hypothetical protein
MIVELFLAREDFTWTTEIMEVPDSAGQGHPKQSPDWDYAISDWARNELASQGHVFSYVSVWEADPEVDEPDEDDEDEEEIANIPQDIE